MALLNWLKGGSSKSSIFGKKPDYKSAELSAAEATNANLANLPKAQELGSKVDTYNQEEMLRLLRKTIPGIDNILKEGSNVLESGLRGEVPKSVQDQLALRSASRALTGGFAGSGAARNLEARDFGLSSWDITNKSLDSASKWTQSVSQLTSPGIFNVGSAFISPQQQFDYNKLKSETDAAPDPRDRGMFDSRASLFGMVTSGYAGGAGYANSYKPASQQGSAPPPGYFLNQEGQLGGGGGGIARYAGLLGGGGGSSFGSGGESF